MVDAGKVTVKVALDASDLPAALTRQVNTELKPALANVQGEVNKATANIRTSIDGVGKSVGGLGPKVGQAVTAPVKAAERDIDTALAGIRSKIATAADGLAKLSGKLAESGGGGGKVFAGLADAAAGVSGGFAEVETSGAAAAGGIAAVGAAAAAAVAAVAAISVAAAATGKALYDIGAEATKTEDKIKFTLGGSKESMEGLLDSAKKLAANNIPESVDQIATAMVKVKRSTGDTGDALEQVTRSVLNFDRKTGETTNIEALGMAFKKFNVAAADQSGVLNQLWQETRTTGLGMNELISGLNRGGMVFKEVGLNLGQSAGLMAQFNKAGIETNKVVPGLQAFFRQMAKAGKDPAESFKDVTTQLKTLIAEGKTADANQFATKMFGRASLPLLDAIKTGTLDLDTLNKSMDTTGDKLNDVAESTDHWSEKWKEFKSQLSIALEPFGKAVFAKVQDGLIAMTAWMSAHTADIVHFFAAIAKAGIDAAETISKVASGISRAIAIVVQTVGGFEAAIDRVDAKLADLTGDHAAADKLRADADSAEHAADRFNHFSDTLDAIDWDSYRTGVDGLASDTNKAIEASKNADAGIGKLADAVQKVPDSKDLVLKSNTPEAIKDVTDLGLKVTTLPDGKLKVTADTKEAEDTLKALQDKVDQTPLKVPVVPVTPGSDTPLPLPAKADGGPIGGIGGPRSDNQLILASPGEHMLTAAEVSRLGGHQAVYRLRDAINRGVLGRFATGGAIDGTAPAPAPAAVPNELLPLYSAFNAALAPVTAAITKMQADLTTALRDGLSGIKDGLGGVKDELSTVRDAVKGISLTSSSATLASATGPLGVPGNVAGINLATIPAAAQKYANDCIDASARIILSAAGVNKTEDQLESIIAPGGSITSQAAGLNALNPRGRYVPMEGSGGSQDALFAAVKASIDKGVGSVLNVAPGSSLAGHTFEPGHFIAATGYDQATGRINVSDTAGGKQYSVSAADAYQATRGRGIVAGTGDGPGAAALTSAVSAGVQTGMAASPTQATLVDSVTKSIKDVVADPSADSTKALDAQVKSDADEAARRKAQEKIDDLQRKIEADKTTLADPYLAETKRGKTQEALEKAQRELTDAITAQTDLLRKQQDKDEKDKAKQDSKELKDAEKAAKGEKPGKAEMTDYSKLPLGDPRRILAGALTGAGGSMEDVNAILGSVAAGAIKDSAPDLGKAAGDAATAAVQAVPIPGPMGPPATPTAPTTDPNKLLAQRDYAGLALATTGAQAPDYTINGASPQGAPMTNAGPGFTAGGQMTGDTSSEVMRTLTSMETENKARQDQLVSALNDIKNQLAAKALGPVVEQSTQAAINGISDAVTARIGKSMGDAAAPPIADKVSSAVADAMAQQQSSGTSAIPGMAAGGGITGGTPNQDSVPAMLMPNEWVLTTADVARMGGFGGVQRFLGALHSSGGIRHFATGGSASTAPGSSVNTGNPYGGQNANASVGADFFGLSQIPVLAVAINALVDVLLTVIGVNIMTRDSLIAVSQDMRQFRSDFKEYDAAGRLKNDNSGLLDRSGSSEQQVADERIRILKLVIDGIINYVIEKVIVPLGKAIGNAVVSALAGAAGGAISSSGPGGSIAGGIVSAAVSAAGAVAIDIAAQVFTVAAEVFASVAISVIGEGLQTLFPQLGLTLFSGAGMEKLTLPISEAIIGLDGHLTVLFTGFGTILGTLISGLIPSINAFVLSIGPVVSALAAVVAIMTAVAGLLQQIITALVDLGVNIFGPIVTGLTPLVNSLVPLASNFTLTATLLAEVSQVLANLIPNVGQGGSTPIPGVYNWLGITPPTSTVSPLTAAPAATPAASTAPTSTTTTTKTINAPITVTGGGVATAQTISTKLLALIG